MSRLLSHRVPLVDLKLRRMLSVSGTFVATFLQFGFFAIQGIVLARMLGPEGRGAFAATIAYPQMLLFLGFLGAADLFAWRAARLLGSDAPLRRAALAFGLLSGLATMVICMLLIAIAMPPEKRTLIPLALLVAATLPFQHVRLAVQAVDHGLGQFHRYNAVRVLGAAAAPLALAVAWLAGVQSVGAAILIYCIAMIVSVALIQWGMNHSWWGPLEPSPGVALREGRGFAVSQVAAELLDRADIGLVLWLGTLVQQGFYAAAVPIAGTMSIVPLVVATYTFRRGATGQRALDARQATWKLCGLSTAQLVSGLTLAAMLPFLVPLLLGETFTPAIRFAWYLLPAAAIRGVVIALDGYLRGRHRSRPGIVGRLVAFAVLLVVTAALYVPLGIFAVPVALTIAQLVCALIVVAAVYQEAADPGELPREAFNE